MDKHIKREQIVARVADALTSIRSGHADLRDIPLGDVPADYLDTYWSALDHANLARSATDQLLDNLVEGD